METNKPIWHKVANELPKADTWVMFQAFCGDCFVGVYRTDTKMFKCFCDWPLDRIARWCYLEPILATIEGGELENPYGKKVERN